MTTLNGKLSPHLVWLFAIGTLGLTILVTKLVPPVTPKVMAGIYFALFGAGATAATFLTRTGAFASIAAFALAGAGLGGYYYYVITSIAPGSGLGQSLGMVFCIAFAVDALAAGISGTLFGLKLRKGLKAATAARAA
jgi:hypothetical protein